jgi:TonB family protein
LAFEQLFMRLCCRFVVVLLLIASASLEARSESLSRDDRAGLQHQIAYPDRVVHDYVDARSDSLLEGVVALRVVIEPTGEVQSLRVEQSAGPLLDSMTQSAVRSYRFAGGDGSERSLLLHVRFDPYADSRMDSLAGDTVIIRLSQEQMKFIEDNSEDPEFDIDDLHARIHYPEEARKANIEGKVMVQVFIDTTGKPGKHKILTPVNPLLEEAAVKAIMETKFTPARVGKRCIGCWVVIPVIFKLHY